jgi:hypothetical protein
MAPWKPSIREVAAAHSVLAQHFDPFGQFCRIGGDHAGVAGGAQILGRVEAEGSDVTERSGLHAVPFRTPGLGCVFHQLESVLLPEARKGCPVGALAVEVDGENGAKAFDWSALQDPVHRFRVQIESRGVDVRQDRSCSGAENAADGGKKAERGGDDGLVFANARAGKGQPEGIRA